MNFLVRYLLKSKAFFTLGDSPGNLGESGLSLPAFRSRRKAIFFYLDTAAPSGAAALRQHCGSSGSTASGLAPALAWQRAALQP
jgi:hypothetical protein